MWCECRMMDWKRIISECGVDWTYVERVYSVKNVWKKCVNERVCINGLRQQGHISVCGPNESMTDRSEKNID